MDPTAPRLVEFGWFGSLVRVRSDDEGLAGLFRRLWGGSPPPPAPRAVRTYEASLARTSPPSISGPFGTRFLDPRLAVWHAYNVVLQDLTGALGDRYLLHAAALSRGGRALVIAGPSGFGKTTLALHLAFRGFTLLSDDMTSLLRGSPEIEAPPRAVHLRGGSRATLLPSQILAVDAAVLDREGDLLTLDARAWGGAPPGPIPLGTLVLLRGRHEARGIRSGPVTYDVWLTEGHGAPEAEIRDLPGVATVVHRPDSAGALHVETTSAGALASWIRDRADAVVAAVEVPLGPDFGAPPRLARVGPFEAAIGICRGLLNRQPGSLLDGEFREREAFLVAEIAETLRGVLLLALRPGRTEETVAALIDVVENRPE